MKKSLKIISLGVLLSLLSGCSSLTPTFGSSDNSSSNHQSSNTNNSISSNTSSSNISSNTDSLTSNNSSTNSNSSISSSGNSSSSNQESSESNDSSLSEDVEDRPIPDISLPSNQYGLRDNIEDGVIFHAWNWSMNNITAALPKLAENGYTTIQTSPMQPQKDYYQNGHYRNEWWKLYQPLGFSIATKNNAIGTKEDLKNLCHEADKYGIKIIVDIVSNHLAGGSKTSFHGGVKEYEPEIFSQNLLHDNKVGVNDNNSISIVQGHIGDYPDLQTESPVVQKRVLSLLKEYIDVGVDGFRFDAAKHIETPTDEEGIRSDYWTYILNGATEYARGKSLPDPYIYGEILNTPGFNRSFNSYTPLMDVTDNLASSKILEGVRKGNFNKVNNHMFNKGLKADNCVLWGESHDTFANRGGDTSNESQLNVNKAYAIAASKKDSTALYFARPDNQGTLGHSNLNVLTKPIKLVNEFHNKFVESREKIVSTGSVYANIRETNQGSSLLLVNSSSSTSLNVNFPYLVDGSYQDKVSNNTLKVVNGKLTGTIDPSGIAIFDIGETIDLPSIEVSNTGEEVIYDPFDLTIDVKNATEAYYQIDNGTKVPFNSSTTIKLFEGVKEGTTSIKVSVKNQYGTITQEYTYQKIDLNELSIVCTIDPNFAKQYELYAWVWSNGNDGHFVKGSVQGSKFTFPYTQKDKQFLVVAMKKGTTKPDWNKKVKQTPDQTIAPGKVFDLTKAFTK